MRILVATSNQGKLKEFRQRLQEAIPTLEIMGLDDIEAIPFFPPENGDSFADNATIKAVHGAQHSELWCLADDSGLVVDALQGRPGIYSARFAGPEATDQQNNEKLLQALEGVPESKRGARFVCALALVAPDKKASVHLEEGVCEGRIAVRPRGQLGFGYDPIFFPLADLDHTFAELEQSQKSALSHRGLALNKMQKYLQQLILQP